MTHTPTDYESMWETLDDFIAYHRGSRHRRRITRQIVRTLTFASCLDVGCGNGSLIQEMRDRFGDNISVVGVDAAESVIERNRLRIPAVDFRQLDIEQETL